MSEYVVEVKRDGVLVFRGSPQKGDTLKIQSNGGEPARLTCDLYDETRGVHALIPTELSLDFPEGWVQVGGNDT